MKNEVFSIPMGEWTERDVLVALYSLWNAKMPMDNYSIVLANILHSRDYTNFITAFYNTLCAIGNRARKKYSSNKKHVEAQEKRALMIAKNLLYCAEKDFFASCYVTPALAHQLCSGSIIGMTLVNEKFVMAIL